MAVRSRYTVLYVVLFLVSGALLVAIMATISVGRTMHVPASADPRPASEQIAHLRQQLDAATANQIQRMWIGAIVALATMLMVSLVLGRLAAWRVLRPLSMITRATRRITADRLHERLAVQGPYDEVKALADTIDDLLGRLEESFSAQRRFVANASHELRTPLATMRASIDVAMAKPGGVPEQTVVLAERIRSGLDQADSLLEGLLLLARAQHGALDDREPVQAGDLVTAALDSWSDEIQTKQIDVYASGTGLETVGNPVLLARMVANVIGNAVVHNVPGGWIRAETGKLSVVVENTGPVLDPHRVAQLGRPFQRLGTERTGNGTGLGLSIASAIATAHGGDLYVWARPEGGIRAEIVLPVADEEEQEASGERSEAVPRCGF